LPQQPHLTQFEMTSEDTEFVLAGDHKTWWIPADYDSYESLYRETPLAQIDAVNTPVTMRTNNGLFLSIHEAALTNYAGMTLQKSPSKPHTLVSELVPWADGIKVKGATPFKSPWRTIQVASSAAALIESDLIENLNLPSVITDTSWIKPMKYVGIWWGMHMRQYTWQAGPKHGATTENTKRYIDFASQHNIGGVLVEGWNKGWETWHTGLNVQNFTQSYADFDLAEIVAYGAKHNVALIGHHETGGNIPMYEQQLEAAFKLYHQVGVHAIKTGYAGNIVPEGEHHHGQKMVNHYRRVLEIAAKYQVMVNAHEPIKATGIRRTYPNMMTREGGRGMEWNGWSKGNSPEHTLMLPFTRLLAGPMDYTPGIFNLKFDPQGQYRVHSTLAKQLAMYVVLYSPLQMAADMIENYQQQPAFEFIENVPVSWDETRVLNGAIGDFITIARRRGQQWFLGSMTDEQARVLEVPLDFLANDTRYVATLYSDSELTEFVANPTAIDIGRYLVSKDDTLSVVMASGGGLALQLSPATWWQTLTLPALTQYQATAASRAASHQKGRVYGEVARVEHLGVNKKISLNTPFDQGYSAGGAAALVDGIRGGADYKSRWQGYRQQDLDATIDLGQLTELSEITIGFMQSILHSILLPTEVQFLVSDDGESFTAVGLLSHDTQQEGPDYQVKDFSISLPQTKARFVRIVATNLNQLPSWHVRPGQETFIFADEIIIGSAVSNE